MIAGLFGAITAPGGYCLQVQFRHSYREGSGVLSLLLLLTLTLWTLFKDKLGTQIKSAGLPWAPRSVSLFGKENVQEHPGFLCAQWYDVCTADVGH